MKGITRSSDETTGSCPSSGGVGGRLRKTEGEKGCSSGSAMYPADSDAMAKLNLRAGG